MTDEAGGIGVAYLTKNHTSPAIYEDQRNCPDNPGTIIPANSVDKTRGRDYRDLGILT